MSFGIFDSYVCFPSFPFPDLMASPRKHILADPTAFEEPLLDTNLSVVIDSTSGDLISVSQVGLGTSSSSGEEDDTLPICISAATKRREELVQANIYV